MRALVLALAAASLGAGCSSLARPWGTEVELRTNLLGGFRAVDHEVFDGHPVIGLELETRDPEVGWGYELGGSYGSEEEDLASDELEAEFDEIYLGVRRTWADPERSLRPYAGVGAAWMVTENLLRTGGPTGEFEDRGAGAYAHTGLMWSLGSYPVERGTEVLVGVDLRGVLGDDIDYGQIALVLGFGR